MKDYKKHLISERETIKEVLLKLGTLEEENILFVINGKGQLVGSVTDGDVRRGLLNNFTTSDKITNIIHRNPKFINKVNYSVDEIIFLRNNNYKVIPVVNDENIVVNIINFRLQKSYLPIDAVIMAGGLGSRLRPLTNDLPKPLLKVGDKEIISYNFDRLSEYGILNQKITVNYLSNLIKDYCSSYNENIDFEIIEEKEFMGTAGSLSLVKSFKNDTVLLMNSDLLTNIDYEDFYKSFIKHNADVMVASIPYSVNLPYAIFDLEDKRVTSFKEKPSYTYYANAGIYLMKKEIIDEIPKGSFFNATDLMQLIIESPDKELKHYPIRNYWLDIGKHEDYEKAQKDVKHIKF
ncbi:MULTISPECIES: sugar phosphate nucleotidyltransferase [Flavobacteriaceae]|uniref:sugar phosphate nucleotidyltransferase n=1 Tax=Flavobacteriaceae TaxID=49546 RepID=UPI003AA81B63